MIASADQGLAAGQFREGLSRADALRDALAHSVNTAAIHLLERTGVDPVRTIARRLGITSPMSRDLSLALGTSEVTLLELAGAYTAFANGGRAVALGGDPHPGPVWPGPLRAQGSGAMPVADPVKLAELNRMLPSVVEYGTGKWRAGPHGGRQDRHQPGLS